MSVLDNLKGSAQSLGKYAATGLETGVTTGSKVGLDLANKLTGADNTHIFGILLPPIDSAGMMKSAVTIQVLGLFVFACLFTCFMSSHVVMKNNDDKQTEGKFFAYLGSVSTILASGVLVALVCINSTRLLNGGKATEFAGKAGFVCVALIVLATLIGNVWWYQTTGTPDKEKN